MLHVPIKYKLDLLEIVIYFLQDNQVFEIFIIYYHNLNYLIDFYMLVKNYSIEVHFHREAHCTVLHKFYLEQKDLLLNHLILHSYQFIEIYVLDFDETILDLKQQYLKESYKVSYF